MNTTWTEKKINRCAGELFLLCFLAYAFSYIGRQNFSACLPAMISDGTLTKAFGGYITTAYMVVYGSGQLLNGIGGSRIRPQYLIGCGLCGAGLMNLCMSFCSLPWLMLVIWSLNGLFHSMLWAPMMRVFTDHLPESKRYAAGVNIAASIPVGTVCAYLIPALFLRVSDWHTVFAVCGGLLLLAFAVWTCGNLRLRAYIASMEAQCRVSRQAVTDHHASTENRHATGTRPSLISVILASGLLLVLLCLLCNGALKDAMNAWIPTFLSERFGLDESTSALVSVIIPIVTVSGAYVSTWINKKYIHNELYTGGVMFVLSAVCILVIRIAGDRSALLCAFCLAVSISSMWGANTMFLTMLPYHFAGLGLTSSVTGFLNCCAYFASAAFSSLYGLAAEWAGWSVLILIWLAISFLGILVCLVGGRIWRKKSQQLDQGTLFDRG